MRAFVLAAVVLGSVLLADERAEACSLAPSATPIEPRALVADADAAFIGTLLDIRAKDPPATSSAGPFIFTYRVEERIKGDLSEQVEVVAAAGASCGLDGPVGRRTGLILTGAPGAWTSWLGDQVAPETLRRGSLPLPNPDGVGPPAFIGGGNFGVARTALLDARGRTLRYGLGRGMVEALSVCPGGDVSVELVRRDGLFLAWRRARTLELIREQRIIESRYSYGDRVVCRTRSGSIALVSVSLRGTAKPEGRLLRVSPVGVRVLERAEELSVAVHGEVAFVSRQDGRLAARNLRSGARRLVALTGQLLRRIAVSPDGRRLVGFTLENLTLVDVRTGANKQIPRRWSPRSDATWLGPDRLVTFSGGDFESFDAVLRPKNPAVPWSVHTFAATTAGAYGVDWTGALLTVRAGNVVRLGRMFSPAVTVLLPLT